MRFILTMILVLGVVSGCGDGASTSTKPSAAPVVQIQTYTISGKARNVRFGTTVILQNNKGDNISISAGSTSFSFPTKILAGGSYDVSVYSHPMQNCSVSHGRGSVSAADITEVLLECTPTHVKKTANIHKKFKAKAKQALRKMHNQQAEDQKIIDLEKQQEIEKQQSEAVAQQQEQGKRQVEKQQLEALAKQQEEQKKLAEHQKFWDLAQQQEEQMLHAEEQRIIDLELQRQQRLEQEKQFQPLHQRQQVERLR